jgi:NAD(P)-dependent dehydrogenase (short-subunit alcohol dehydrogenase family)
MDLELNGKKAIVTGSSAGIGFSIAEELAREGAEVILNGRTQKRVDDALAKLKASTPKANARGVAADLGTAAGAEVLFKAVPDVDILVNNVGIYEPKDFENITDEDWLRMFEVNVMSGIRASRHYIKGMLKRNWGRIIFISSESAVNIPVEMIHYGMTKTAQIAIARGLAETTVGTGVTVNSVLPGPTASEGVEEFVNNLARSGNKHRSEIEKEFFEKVRPSSLIKRFATSEEVAHMVAYVASSLSSATNGAALRVDGGTVRSIL